MKCVCRKPCQTRMENGKIRFFDLNAVEDFKECPVNFDPIEGEDAPVVDFETAGEEELLESEFELKELKDFIFKRYDRKTGSRGKYKTIKVLLDCRYRDIGDTDINSVV